MNQLNYLKQIRKDIATILNDKYVRIEVTGLEIKIITEKINQKQTKELCEYFNADCIISSHNNNIKIGLYEGDVND